MCEIARSQAALIAKFVKFRRRSRLIFANFAMRAAWLRAFAPIFQILVAGRPPKSEKSGQTRTSKSKGDVFVCKVYSAAPFKTTARSPSDTSQVAAAKQAIDKLEPLSVRERTLFWEIFGNILKKIAKNSKNTRLHIKCARFARTSGV